jgi:hypothetical protein
LLDDRFARLATGVCVVAGEGLDLLFDEPFDRGLERRDLDGGLGLQRVGRDLRLGRCRGGGSAGGAGRRGVVATTTAVGGGVVCAGAAEPATIPVKCTSNNAAARRTRGRWFIRRLSEGV